MDGSINYSNNPTGIEVCPDIRPRIGPKLYSLPHPVLPLLNNSFPEDDNALQVLSVLVHVIESDNFIGLSVMGDVVVDLNILSNVEEDTMHGGRTDINADRLQALPLFCSKG